MASTYDITVPAGHMVLGDHLFAFAFSLRFDRSPFRKMFRRTCCRGVRLPPSNNQVCKKKYSSNELTRIFDFQLAALALKLKLLF